jgi:hypothetical protein
MIPPAGMAMAAITVMLWILWSDTIRARRGPRVVYALRILSYLAMAGVLVWNAMTRPELFGIGGRLLVFAAVLIAITGAIYFGRKFVKRT